MSGIYALYLPSIRHRIIMQPAAVEFLVHMSLSAAVASVNSLADDCLVADRADGKSSQHKAMSRSEHSAPVAARKTVPHQRVSHTSITGAQLDLKWQQLSNLEYLTDGGNSWIHTAVYNEKPVVVKTLKPECQDVAVAINEIEGELGECSFTGNGRGPILGIFVATCAMEMLTSVRSMLAH